MTRRICLALAALFVIAAFTRLYALERRPPHHDEGVNGFFTEKVVRDGHYTYDPANYHGPSYFYLLAGSRALLGSGVWELRLPGALAGIALCLAPLLLRRRLGWSRALAACALLAASPTLVYYARYAIHETLLAALGLLAAACMLRWADRGSPAWLVGAAAAMAGMIATKETTIIFLAAGGVWLVGETAVETWRARRFTVLGHAGAWSWRVPAVAVAMIAAMLAIHVLLFTGFFQTPGSIAHHLERSLSSYTTWADTGTKHGGHEKDVCYYLHLGVRYELVLYVLAAVGALAGFRERFVRGPAIVGALMFVIYSLVPYKMPWLPVSWLALLAVPAGHGVTVLARVLADELSARAGVVAATVVALVPALVITARSSFERPADVREGLAYVHTHADYNRWFPLVERGGARVGASRLVVGVDHPCTWPLAWTLAPYRNTRWFVEGNEDVIVVAVSRAAAVEAKLQRSYLRGRYEMSSVSEPAHVYFRRSMFSSLAAARVASGELVVVGPVGRERPSVTVAQR